MKCKNQKGEKEEEGEERRRKQKGITLIALVITIIVLLILAGVAINMLSGENGILKQAEKAKEKTEQAQEQEQKTLASMEAATNLENTEYKGVTIPAGFAVSPIEDEQDPNTGLVIIDSNGNEYVWIAVDDINDMVMCQGSTGDDDCDIIKKEEGKLICTTHGKSICGKLYATGLDNNFDSKSETQTYSANSGLREAAVVTGKSNGKGTSYDGNSTYQAVLGYGNTATIEDVLSGFQTSFEQMALSVFDNKGFYIGRYEMGSTSSTLSKQGIMPVSAADKTYSSDDYNRWYGLYKTANSYLSSSVQSQMIWGCQYDQVMKWLESDYDITDSSSWGNYRDVEFTYTGENGNTYTKEKDTSTKIPTGSSEHNKANNIYDIAGNLQEWTQEANDTLCRVCRGGTYRYGSFYDSASGRGFIGPDFNDSDVGSRVTLYIK